MIKIKEVKGYKGKYYILSNGIVLNSKFEKLAQTPNSEGYLRVQLWKNNKRKNFRVNRLVAEHFCKKKNQYTNEVLHLDNNRNNNNFTNLKWGTRKENMKERWKDGIHTKFK